MSGSVAWPARAVRSMFLDYFRSRGHQHVASSSVIPRGPEGTYFVNAGMNQFKPLIQGTCAPHSEMGRLRRVVNSQKCVRVGGKHGDLDVVGTDGTHHTFFEMLGNWSFGGAYWKKAACEMALDLLENKYGLPRERLYVTYFGGSAEIDADLECREIWRELGLPEARIVPCGAEHNLWTMSDTGPCGPCTEIHYDLSPPGGSNSSSLDPSRVNRDPDVVELWNLVFMQQYKNTDGSLSPLASFHVDTGMGLERLVAILQGKTSNYQTDLFTPLLNHLEQHGQVGPFEGSRGDVHVAYQTVADHLRMITVCAADGMRPGPRGLEHRLRFVMDRCFRQAARCLRVPLDGAALPNAAYVIAQSLGDVYPEIQTNVELIREVISEGQKSFVCRDREAHNAIKDALKKHGNPSVLTGAQAFELRSRVSPEALRAWCKDLGVRIDEAEYGKMMHSEEKKSRKVTKELQQKVQWNAQMERDFLESVRKHNIPTTDDSFKYTHMELKATLLGFEEASPNHEHPSIDVVLDKTCFFWPSEGQPWDFGHIYTESAHMVVRSVESYQGYVVHKGFLTKGRLSLGDQVTVSVTAVRRDACARNHTGTHVLNHVLNERLGGIVQRDSSINNRNLKFIFTCDKDRITDKEIEAISADCNDIVSRDLPVHTHVLPVHEALRIPGVRTVKGQDYPDTVRVVSIGPEVNSLLRKDDCTSGGSGNAFSSAVSVELCGGTHVSRTGQLEGFVLTKFCRDKSKKIFEIKAVTGARAKKALMMEEMVEKKMTEVLDKIKTDETTTWEQDRRDLLSMSGDFLSLTGTPLKLKHKLRKILDDMAARKKNRHRELDYAKRLRSLLQREERFLIEELDWYSSERKWRRVFTVVAPNKPVFLLSADKTHGAIHGLCYVPEDSELCAGEWAEVLGDPIPRKRSKKFRVIRLDDPGMTVEDAAGKLYLYAAERLGGVVTQDEAS